MREIIYKHKKLEHNDINQFLMKCDNFFIPKLSERIDIYSYSKKISTFADHFIALYKQQLIGFLACYLNDSKNQIAFITSISVDQSFQNKGIASRLLSLLISYAKHHNYLQIWLKVDARNSSAIKLYHKFGFKETISMNDFIEMKLLLT